MTEYNLDIFPKKETVEQFPNIRDLILNETVQEAFAVREQRAASAKRQYHGLGRWGISLIAIAAIYSGAEGLVLSSLAVPHWLSLLAAICAVVGVGLQIYLLATHRKRDWLVNRFAAERLRSIKFQAFIGASVARDPIEVKTTTHDFCVEAIRALDEELADSASALAKFAPSRALRFSGAAQEVLDSRLAADVRSAYLQLRTNFQKEFAAGERRRIEEGSEPLKNASDLIYLLGAAVVGAALLSKLGLFGTPLLQHWLDFAALAMFVTGISLAVLENASINEDSQARYELYEQDLADLIAKETGPKGNFESLAIQTELLALRELAEFCRAADRITYRV